jgi:hypothetical protein
VNNLQYFGKKIEKSLKTQIDKLTRGIVTKETYDALHLFRLLEKRIIEGLAILRFVTGENTTKDWESQALEWFEEQASQNIIPWTFNRCVFDHVKENQDYVDVFNANRKIYRDTLLNQLQSYQAFLGAVDEMSGLTKRPTLEAESVADVTKKMEEFVISEDDHKL